MATVLNFTVANNATWSSAPFALLDADDAPLALPAGTKIEMQLREAADSQNVALGLSLASGLIVIQDQNAATVSIEVPATAMASVSAAAYAHDIIVTQPSGRVHRPYAGIVTVQQGVTR